MAPIPGNSWTKRRFGHAVAHIRLNQSLQPTSRSSLRSSIEGREEYVAIPVGGLRRSYVPSPPIFGIRRAQTSVGRATGIYPTSHERTP